MSPRRKRPGPEHVAEAARWLAWARGDLITAIENAANPSVPHRNAAFLAQQAAEKAIKAVILLDGRGFDEVHDLEALATQLPEAFGLPVSVDELVRVSDLATAARHPDEGDTVTGDDATAAIGVATAVCEAVVEHFNSQGIDRSSIAPQ